MRFGRFKDIKLFKFAVFDGWDVLLGGAVVFIALWALLSHAGTISHAGGCVLLGVGIVLLVGWLAVTALVQTGVIKRRDPKPTTGKGEARGAAGQDTQDTP